MIDLKLYHTISIINDLKSKLSDGIDSDDPIVIHVLKTAIIVFSAEMEFNLKKIFKILLKYHPNRNDHIEDMRNIIDIYYNKLRNPKFRDIKDFCAKFNIDFDLDDADKQQYSNIVSLRDKLVHDPKENVTITLAELEKGIEIGENIINKLANSVFNIITRKIKAEFV